MLRGCYVLADVIIFVYELPRIFWHYINVDKLVSWITLKKLLKSAMELLQIATAFFIKKCDTVCYKLRQVLQSAMIITNCDSTSSDTSSVSMAAPVSQTSFREEPVVASRNVG